MNDIVPASLPDMGDDWKAIVDELQKEVPVSELPDKVVQATEYLVSGWPTYKIARRLNVAPSTVRKWLSDYLRIWIRLKVYKLKELEIFHSCF